MSFINQFCKMAGYLHPSARWKYGRTKVVYAYDYSAPDTKFQKKYLDSAYKNPVSILSEPNSPQMKTLLSDLTVSDKLIIVSHADENGLVSITQKMLVERLIQHGLKEVGVIKFHSCELGKKYWLHNFADRLKTKGVSFAWVSGPVGSYIYWPFHRWAGIEDASTFRKQMQTGKYRIVKGNINKIFQGSRYTAET
jgi:hypothetical protein